MYLSCVYCAVLRQDVKCAHRIALLAIETAGVRAGAGRAASYLWRGGFASRRAAAATADRATPGLWGSARIGDREGAAATGRRMIDGS